MRFALRFSRRCVAVFCLLFAAGVALGQNTTLVGTVYAPMGPYNPNPDPIPNVLVFIAPVGSTLPDIDHSGQGITGGCAAQSDLVGLTPLVFTTTDYKGSFTLSSPSLNALPTGTYNLVIQAGKWRRQYASTNIIQGQPNNVGKLYMPGSAADGDLPRIAIVTGAADSIECILPQMGISTSEVTPTSGTGHINLFPGRTSSNGADGSAGAYVDPTGADNEYTLMTNPALLNSYDMLLFGCRGNPNDTNAVQPAQLGNLANFANNGGRVFGTHYEADWFSPTQTFAAAAHWVAGGNSTNLAYSSSIIDVNYTDPNFPEGKVLADWLHNLFPTIPYGEITNVGATLNQTGINPPTKKWGVLHGGTTEVMQLSFDTPLSGAVSGGGATVSLAFTNNPTAFKLSDPADNILLDVTNTSAVVANQLSLTLTVPPVLTVTSLAGANANTGWTCNVGTLTCSTSGLAGGTDDPIAIVVSVAATNPTPGKTSVTATLSGVSISSNSSCGRVMYNQYHVESGSNSRTLFPSECSTVSGNAASAQKFLEYSLYNLSNFISPTNSDTIVIQSTPTVTWTPPATVYYGQPFDSTILNATADTPGTFTYTYAGGTLNPLSPTLLDAQSPSGATYTITANFTPTDATDYLNASTVKSVTVLPDPTLSVIPEMDTATFNSIFYGQEIGFINGVDAQLEVNVQTPPGYPVAPSGGTFTALIDGKTACAGTLGQGAVGGARPGACPDGPFLGQDVGAHTMQLVYSGDNDFLPSQSKLYPVTVNPDPTTAAVVASQGSLLFGGTVTLTGSVTDRYIDATGPVAFYDSLQATGAVTESLPNVNPVAAGLSMIGGGSVSVGAQSVSLPLANLLPGPHNISVCYTAQVNKSGTYNYLNSCSASTAVNVALPAGGPQATAPLLKSSANPSVVGQAVSFTAIVQTTGPFPQTGAGSVVFYDAGTAIGSGTLAADGTAVLTTSMLTLGSHAITVKYAGNTALAASTSAALTQVVGQPLLAAGPGFLLLVDQTKVPVYVGSTVVVNVQVVPLTNFNQPVTLACTGMPTQAGCTFAQATMPVGGGKTQLLLSSGAPHDCSNSTPYFASFGGRGILSLASLCSLTLCFARKRRKLRGIALAGLLLALPGLVMGCGSGNCTDFAVKPGDYSFTITGTPGALTGAGTAYTTTITQDMVMHVHL